MAILVTGGAGYIGSHCVAALIERGADVVVVDDLSKGHREALKGGRLYVGSVADRAFLDDVFSKEPIEAVIHFAAFSLVGESMQVPEQYFRNNVTAGLTLIETMLAHKVPYLVFSSTAATFGEPEYVPSTRPTPRTPPTPTARASSSWRRCSSGATWPTASSSAPCATSTWPGPGTTAPSARITGRRAT